MAQELYTAYSMIALGFLCIVLGKPLSKLMDKFLVFVFEETGTQYPSFPPIVCRICGFAMIVSGLILLFAIKKHF